MLHCASLLRIISRVSNHRANLKMAAFSLRLGLAIKVNRHFLENEYGDLSFFCCFELGISLCKIIMDQFSVYNKSWREKDVWEFVLSGAAHPLKRVVRSFH